MSEMPIPDAALRDKDSVEMLRVWIAEKQLHCSVKVGMYHEGMNFNEGTAWGIMLADATRHIAMAMEKRYSVDQEELIREIQVSYMKEISKPTSEATGEFVERPKKH